MTQTSQNEQGLEDEHKRLSKKIETTSPRSRLSAAGTAAMQFISSQYWIVCLAIGALALACNLYQLGKPSMWFDEILSVERARQSLLVLLKIIAATQPNMALYYVLLHGWLGLTALLGWLPTEVVVRFPSAVFSALSAMVLFLLGRRFLGLLAGTLAASLYVLNDLQLVYAQQTRSYALQLLLICLAWYSLLAALSLPAQRKRWWLCYALVSVLAVYAHLFSVLILAAQISAYVVLWLLPGAWRASARQQLRTFLLVHAAIFVLILPLLALTPHRDKTGWIPIPHLNDLYHVFLTISAESRPYLFLLLSCCLLGLLVVGLSTHAWGKRVLTRLALMRQREDPRLARFQQELPVGVALLCWLIIPLVLSYLISQGSTPVFSSRYLVTIIPPFLLLVGLGLTVLRWRVVQVVLALGLLLLTLHYLPIHYQSAQLEDWNTTSFWLEHHYQANDGLVCYDNANGCQVSIEYYLTAYPSAAHFTADSPGSFPWVTNDLTDNSGHPEAAIDPKALATFASNHPRLFFIVGRISGQTEATRVSSTIHWLNSHYQFIDQIVTPTVTIRLYATG